MQEPVNIRVGMTDEAALKIAKRMRFSDAAATKEVGTLFTPRRSANPLSFPRCREITGGFKHLETLQNVSRDRCHDG